MLKIMKVSSIYMFTSSSKNVTILSRPSVFSIPRWPPSGNSFHVTLIPRFWSTSEACRPSSMSMTSSSVVWPSRIGVPSIEDCSVDTDPLRPSSLLKKLSRSFNAWHRPICSLRGNQPLSPIYAPSLRPLASNPSNPTWVAVSIKP